MNGLTGDLPFDVTNICGKKKRGKGSGVEGQYYPKLRNVEIQQVIMMYDKMHKKTAVISVTENKWMILKSTLSSQRKLNLYAPIQESLLVIVHYYIRLSKVDVTSACQSQ